jgi:hypothetical protein
MRNHEGSSPELQTGHIPHRIPFTQTKENKRHQTREWSECKNDKTRQGNQAPSCTRKLQRYGMLLCSTIRQFGSRPPHCEVSRSQAIIQTRAQTHKHAHTVGLLQTTACPVVEASSNATRNKHNTRMSMLSVVFESVIPAIAELRKPHGHRDQHFNSVKN